MTLNFKDIPTVGGGWFKPVDHQDAPAILVEVADFDRQRPTPNGPKDSALCTISVFKDREALDALAPEINASTRVEQTLLARDLEGLVGAATIVTVDQIPPKRPGSHPAWVWRPVNDAAVRQKVIDYATRRESAVTQAAATAPAFD
ncbi:hypothetical protein ACIBCB_18455 [Streptomyces uncialis]|uniref:hypothetical protein n=1 Tax=Streptomyces uncialis TaxID=1048205 RepID=UPI00379280DF